MKLSEFIKVCEEFLKENPDREIFTVCGDDMPGTNYPVVGIQNDEDGIMIY